MVGTRATQGTHTLLNGLGDQQGDASGASTDNSEAENAASGANTAASAHTTTVAAAVGVLEPAAKVAGTRKGRQPGRRARKLSSPTRSTRSSPSPPGSSPAAPLCGMKWREEGIPAREQGWSGAESCGFLVWVHWPLLVWIGRSIVEGHIYHEELFTAPCFCLFIIAQVLIMVAAPLKCCCGCGHRALSGAYS